MFYSPMFKLIDHILNTIPMYRMTLYFVMFLWITAIIFGFFGALPYSGFEIMLSGIFFSFVSWLVNECGAFILNVPTNHESAFITGLILTLIVSPASSVSELWTLGAIASIAMGSKYIFAIRGKHIFNPAGIAVVISGFMFEQGASWWIGTITMVPFVVFGGYFLVRKIAREDMAFSFVFSVLSIGLSYALFQEFDILTTLDQIVLSSGLLFFATVMLTEPRTTPPTRRLRIIYGMITGSLFLPFMHIWSLYATPELALIIGNIFVYLVSSKQKLVLSLAHVDKLSVDLYEFSFTSNRKFNFKAGQYLEWTLGNVAHNLKGNRRYFTIASSPGERVIKVAMRMQEPVSEFKHEMLALSVGDTISASQLSGDFVLPEDVSRKLAFIAGGIGITPFRSMVTHMLDTADSRVVTLFYAGRTIHDIVYTDVFERAREEVGIETIYTVDDVHAISQGWNGNVGRITGAMIRDAMPDYHERLFYISGSHVLVSGMQKILKELGVARSNIKTDYFPGII